MEYHRQLSSRQWATLSQIAEDGDLISFGLDVSALSDLGLVAQTGGRLHLTEAGKRALAQRSGRPASR